MRTMELGKRYGRRWALRDCTLTLPDGAFAALVGPNGAGKTTLLSILAGLLRPTTGRAETPDVAFVAQDKPLYRDWTVGELMRLGAAMNPRWSPSRATSMLGALSLEQKAGQLSGGQRTRVALALAVGRQAELILLDEPLADLDPLARLEILEVIGDLPATVVLSSHVLAELTEICDHLILLAEGTVRLSGSFADLLATHDAASPAELVIGQLRKAAS
ncbi:ABC transporter ATP-binding protein [Nonomuraea endophytica]|uniref:ABC-2 type transport system ATP-binding protein n=1 Tax=Nonomuraea endophytica TaxID=714136 RepID=A0A7W8EGT0_9ACTN|nr:ABC transporter ATP-binding protein [Nonomuraea endophytica]MBB5078803.1 ABC-2 type transport system ATP-binding protein [Nonomuraea endophytica]